MLRGTHGSTRANSHCNGFLPPFERWIMEVNIGAFLLHKVVTPLKKLAIVLEFGFGNLLHWNLLIDVAFL
jgi:hypothetical protein